MITPWSKEIGELIGVQLSIKRKLAEVAKLSKHKADKFFSYEDILSMYKAVQLLIHGSKANSLETGQTESPRNIFSADPNCLNSMLDKLNVDNTTVRKILDQLDTPEIDKQTKE